MCVCIYIYTFKQAEATARTVGLAAVKYADLSMNRESNYRFSYEKMLGVCLTWVVMIGVCVTLGVCLTWVVRGSHTCVCVTSFVCGSYQKMSGHVR